MRRVLWVLGAPVRALLSVPLLVWRRTVGPLLGPRCRFHPSCSEYALEAIRTRGAIAGSGLAVWRVLRCSPLSRGGPDPVPGRAYDTVIRGGAA